MNNIKYYKIEDLLSTSISTTINSNGYGYNSSILMDLPTDFQTFIVNNRQYFIDNFKNPHTDRNRTGFYNDYYFYYSSFLDSNEKNIFPFLGNISFSAKKTSDCIELLTGPNYSSDFTIDNFSNFNPTAVRYTNGTNIWIIERPPFQAQITYRPTKSSSSAYKKEKTYNIWMPWTVMVIDMNPQKSLYKSFLFFNDSPLTSFDDYAIPCFFPNMYTDGSMCLNQTSILLQQHLSSINSYTVSDIYNFIINDYMMGGWNVDLGIHNFDSMVKFVKKSIDYCFDQYQFDHPFSPIDIYKFITTGDGTKKYPYVTTSRSFTNQSKVISNFLTYMSELDLDQVLNIITSIKNTITVKDTESLNSSVKYNLDRLTTNVFTTYSGLLSKLKIDSSSTITLDSIFTDYTSSKSHYTSEYKIFIDPKLGLNLLDDYTPSVDELRNKFILNLNNFIQELDKDNCSKLINNSFYCENKFHKENPFIYANDIDSFYILNKNDSCSIMYSSILEMMV